MNDKSSINNMCDEHITKKDKIMGNHDSLVRGRENKFDEYYTPLREIEKEVAEYTEHFKDAVVYCNCDDPRSSNFFHYFSYNFENLGLKKLISTCYNKDGQGMYLEYEGDKNGNLVPDDEEIVPTLMDGDGDFRSAEAMELLSEATIVVSNPPFSLFREYIAQLIEFKKKFLIIGNMNATTNKDIFPLIKSNQLWLGHELRGMTFRLPVDAELGKTGYIKNGSKFQHVWAIWFTNIETPKRHTDIILYKTYTPEEFPTYDNYDAINVDKVKDIPMDYDGIMGVPITFAYSYNPEQFEIIGDEVVRPNIDGKRIYRRILVKNKRL